MQTILVCDDDKEIVDAIDIYLTGEGFHILKAYDGYDALKILETEHADLMIIDVMMPGLDGIRTTLKVRETSSIPIIILSAKSEDSDKILGLNIGADDYLSKPFNPLELVARVKSQLRRYTQLGNLSQGSNEDEAAVLLGASGWQMFRRVTLPNIRWALLYGVVLTNARAIGEFGAVSVDTGSIRAQTLSRAQENEEGVQAY